MVDLWLGWHDASDFVDVSPPPASYMNQAAAFTEAGELLVCAGRSKSSSSPASDVLLLSLATLAGATLSTGVDEEGFAWSALHAVPFPGADGTNGRRAGSAHRLVLVGALETSCLGASQLSTPGGTPLRGSASSPEGGSYPPPSSSPPHPLHACPGLISMEWHATSKKWLPLTSGGGPGGTPGGGACSTVPIAREQAASAALRKRVFVFGGVVRGVQASALPEHAPWLQHARVPAGPAGAARDMWYLADTWVLNVEKRKWKQHAAGGRPPSPRYGAAMAANEASLTLIVHGGMDATGATLGDVHVLTLQAAGGAERSHWSQPDLAGSVLRGSLGHSLTAVGDWLVVLGGREGGRTAAWAHPTLLHMPTWTVHRDEGGAAVGASSPAVGGGHKRPRTPTPGGGGAGGVRSVGPPMAPRLAHTAVLVPSHMVSSAASRAVRGKAPRTHGEPAGGPTPLHDVFVGGLRTDMEHPRSSGVRPAATQHAVILVLGGCDASFEPVRGGSGPMAVHALHLWGSLRSPTGLGQGDLGPSVGAVQPAPSTTSAADTLPTLTSKAAAAAAPLALHRSATSPAAMRAGQPALAPLSPEQPHGNGAFTPEAMSQQLQLLQHSLRSTLTSETAALKEELLGSVQATVASALATAGSAKVRALQSRVSHLERELAERDALIASLTERVQVPRALLQRLLSATPEHGPTAASEEKMH